MEIPSYDGDLFNEQGIVDPYPHYQRIRDLGPVVWLAATGVHAVTRFADVRAVLGDDRGFVSGEGVMFSDVANELTKGTLLASDRPLHDQLRRIVAHRLTPRALGGQRPLVEEIAAGVVGSALGPGSDEVVVDGVADLARAMPMSFVPTFLGFPPECHPLLLAWASGAIEAGGPASERTPAAVARAQELGAYAAQLITQGGLLTGSLGEDLVHAHERGDIDVGQAIALLIDYFGPSLETTISALGSALWLFAEHPDQWDRLRAYPDLMGSAISEVVRLETPLRAFTRVAGEEREISGVPVPRGTRVAVFYPSANRDERVWDRPDEFDIGRDNAWQLGLGYGAHACIGQGLARMEIGAVLSELAGRVERFELSGEPTRTVNSMLRSFDRLPLRLHLDRAA